MAERHDQPVQGGQRDLSQQIRYLRRPYVCGAIGRWDAAVLQRLRDASPAGLREVTSTPLAALWATGRPRRWQRAGIHGFFWGDLASGSTPRGWTDAAENQLAAGLQTAEEETILHTDALAMQDLYVRRIGAALYFSVRIDPLLDIDDARLHTDWTAWASIAAVTAPLAESTPFEEVRRLGAGTAWRARGSGLARLSFEPSWLDAEPDEALTAADIIDVVGEVVEGNHSAITLSGGWDSRLLAMLASRKTHWMDAWTTSNDDGRDRDITYAADVARALGLRHHILLPGAEAWVEEYAAGRFRLGFQTTHHIWIMPLVRALHRQSKQFIDGLAGDVLFKNLFVTKEIAEVTDPASRRRLLWHALEQRRLQQRNLLSPGVAAAFEDLSRTSFDEAVARFDGHPAAATLAVLHTRTARAIASSAQWLLGPEVQVSLPFLHPAVIRSALQVPLSAKDAGVFYRAMLTAADSAVAALPSTNDPVQPKGARGVRRQATPMALATMAESILSDPATTALLGEEMELALKDPNALGMISRSTTGLRLLNWVSLFGDWRARYAAKLADQGFDGH